jgi:MFS transporter, YNFM family, putative membrane transport protein
MDAREITEARLAEPSSQNPSGGGLRGLPAVTALFATGFGTFVNLYAPQPMLPRFRELFHASELMVSLTVSAPVLAIALAAPLVGLLADAVGRKRVIVVAMLGLSIPTLLAATSTSLGQLIVWRFLQGLLTPGIIAVAIAYIGEEAPRESVGASMSIYVSGTIAGGFAGRFMTGMLEPLVGWRLAFVALGLSTLAMAATTWRMLPRASKFRRQLDVVKTFQAFRSHLSNKQLMATCLVGFNLLFTLVGVFTYVNFYLADKPFNLGSGALSLIFTVYLAGVVITPFAGRLMDRIGSRRTLLFGAWMASFGILLTLLHSTALVVTGLALLAVGAFSCQTTASSQVGKAAGAARSSAAGLYVSLYYLGGCVGSVIPGLLWHWVAWPGCVAIMVCVQAFTAFVAWRMWKA